jgi:hypothetical protein
MLLLQEISDIGSLLEIYFQEKRIRYFPLGSTTLLKQTKRGGVEPDETYCRYRKGSS